MKDKKHIKSFNEHGENLNMENKTIKIDDEITFWVPYPNMPPSQKGKVVNVKDSYMTVISKTDGKEWTINIRHGLYSHQSNN